jgi:hypothetical protein
MARWLIQRTARGNDGITVFYDNLVTKMRYELGKLSSDVPDSMIVDWIFAYGDPAYGDAIVLSDGTFLTFHAPEASAAA